MTESQLISYFPIIFPFFFVMLWLLVTGLLWSVAGWNSLQEAFPDRDEKASATLIWQSGAIGRSLMIYRHVSYGRCLNFGVCKSGLRVSLMWIFRGLWCKPFLIPWSRISVEDVRFLGFLRYKRLSFLGFDGSSVFLTARSFDRLAKRSGGVILPTAKGSAA